MKSESIAKQLSMIFSQLRQDKNYHLGLGDIRLTVGQQEDIIRFVSENTSQISPDAINFEVFAIKNGEAFIGFNSENGNFNFLQVPYTGKELK